MFLMRSWVQVLQGPSLADCSVDSRRDVLGLGVHDDGEGIWHLRPIAISNADFAPSWASLAQDVRLSILSYGFRYLRRSLWISASRRLQRPWSCCPRFRNPGALASLGPRLIVGTPASSRVRSGDRCALMPLWSWAQDFRIRFDRPFSNAILPVRDWPNRLVPNTELQFPVE